MTKPRHSRAISRGRRFGSVDYVLLSIPLVGFLTLLMPLALSLFYYGPMTTQNGEFGVVDCTRLSANDDEASYACSGEFVPTNGSDPITRPPHVFSDEGKMPEPGDTLDLTLYENDALVTQGESPLVYTILYVSGGSFAFVGVFILWGYLARWRARNKPREALNTLDEDDADAASSRTGSPPQSEFGTSALTNLPIQPNGWDAETRSSRYGHVSWAIALLALSLVGTVVGFGSAVGAAVHRTTIPHSSGVVTIADCTVDLQIDTSNRRPVVACQGAFTETENAANTYMVSDRVEFEPEDHKTYEVGESVPVTVYQDGEVRDSTGLDPRSIPGLVWGITLAGTSILLGGLLWLSRAATRP
jgi:hypothetical protein